MEAEHAIEMQGIKCFWRITMSDTVPPAPPVSKKKKKQVSPKKERLSEALKANLRRRKKEKSL